MKLIGERYNKNSSDTVENEIEKFQLPDEKFLRFHFYFFDGKEICSVSILIYFI